MRQRRFAAVICYTTKYATNTNSSNHRASGGRLPAAKRLDGTEQEKAHAALRSPLHALDSRGLRLHELVDTTGNRRPVGDALRARPDANNHLLDDQNKPPAEIRRTADVSVEHHRGG